MSSAPRTSQLRSRYEELLPLVEKPGRYLGGERGTYEKTATVDVRVALAFPDVYEIGQSHLGLQILYDLLNQRPDIAAERVYAPWIDMEALLRERNLPLVSLETFTPLDAFDIVGFSLQYELTYTNIVTMLELGRIPLLSADRGAGHPLIIAGGPGAFNPEPIADFIDVFVLGDGEEAILEVCAVYHAWDRRDRGALLEALRHVSGVYVPAFFAPRYHADGTIAAIEPAFSDYAHVEKRVLRDLNDSPVPSQPVVPNTSIVHERPSVEVMRGCVKGCRFCQAGYVYRPQRERDPLQVREHAIRLIEQTGYEELSLLSLSTGDYSCINPILRDLMNRFAPQRVAISLPSTRIDAISAHVVEELRRARKTGFTLAPEAGSQRMRDIIQKEYKEDELLDAARLIFGLGWRNLKLYFMLGLPGETEDDLLGIVDLCRKVVAAGRSRPQVTASVSTFVPKPHTPFQWAAQVDLEETQARQSILRRELGRHRIRFKWHDARLSFLEGIFSRGDRRLARLILAAQRLGCRFDGWTDQCRWELWQQAMKDCEVDPAFYLRRRPLGEILPWDHLHSGVTKKYLQQELGRAVEGTLTPDCSIERCTYCGACDFKTVQNVSYHLHGAKGTTYRGGAIDGWASRQLPEAETWETKSWQQAQARLRNREAAAARARGARSPDHALESVSLVAAGQTAANLPGEGNAEEWLDAPLSAVRAAQNGHGARTRVRLEYTKRDRARFIGSRELAELFYRAARRAGIPVAFSEGYHPLPRLSFGPGLPVGVASDGEFVDIDLADSIAPDLVASRLGAQLPAGLEVVAAAPLPLDAQRIEPAIERLRYVVELPEAGPITTLVAERIAAYDAAATYPVGKRTGNGSVKMIDVRPTTSIRLAGPRHLEIEIECTSRGTIQPGGLVAALLGLDDDTARGLRVTKTATVFRNPAGPAAASAATL